MQIFCAYCGTKIIATNENEFIFRHVDEAGLRQAETERMIGLRQAETERMVELKKLEITEKKMEEEKKAKSVRMWIIISLVLVMIISFAIGAASGDNDSPALLIGWICGLILMFMVYAKATGKKEEYDVDSVRVPNGIIDYEKKNYAAIEEIFMSAGFTNIKCVPLHDLTFGLFKKPGLVESISINGGPASVGETFPRNSKIVISYHSIAGK